MQFVPKCCKTKAIREKRIDFCPWHLILFLLHIRLKKYVIKLFPKNILCYNIASIDIRPKKMCGKSAYVFLPILKFVLDWLIM